MDISNEFLGRIREEKAISQDEELDLSYVLSVELVLRTATPVTVGNKTLTEVDDSYCDKSDYWPYLKGQKLKVEFEATQLKKLCLVYITRLVPNPAYETN